MWKVYDKTGKKVRCEVRKIQYSGTFMGECFVNTTLYSETPIDFEIGDYLIYRNEYFTINYDPSVLKKAGRRKSGEAYTYDGVKFNSHSDELTRCDFLDYVLYDNNVHFSSLPTFSFYAASIQDLADRIQANLDRIYIGDRKWTITVHPEFVDTTNVNIDASKIKVWGALDFIKSKFKANFVIRGRNITIGTAGIAVDNVFQYGKDKGLFEIQRVAESNQQIITRLRAYGSTRNLPARYYNKLSDSALTNYLPNNMAVQNLMLPDFPYKTLDVYLDSANISALGIREDSVYFDGSDESLPEIYPSMEGMTAQQLIDSGIPCSVDSGDNGKLDEVAGDATNKDGSAISDDGAWSELKEGDAIPPFTLTLKDIGFDINKYLSGESATISMKSGMCGGRDFEITKCVKDGNKYTLTCNRVHDEGLKLYFPYKSYNIKAGDSFVLLNIKMPEVYITAAAQRLLKAGKDFLAKNDYVRYTYEVKIDEIYMARHPQLYDLLKEGDLMLFTEEDFHIDGSIIIDSLRITEGEGLIPTYEVTLANDKQVGTLEKIQNSIDSISGGQGSSGYNTQQILSLIKTYGFHYFLRKDQPDSTKYLLSLLGGAIFGKDGFASGLTGFGAKIDEFGYGEMRGLRLWEFLEVPELRFNRVEVFLGIKWRVPGAGIVESVEIDTDAEGNELPTGTVTLKLEEGEFGAVSLDDIALGIYHYENPSDNATSDADDSKGNFSFSGFGTSYFRITEVTGDNRNQFRYSLRPGFKLHPRAQMHFSSYGNFTDNDRQTSVYETRTYTRMLWKQNTWEISAANIAMQQGDLSNLGMHGMQMEGYSMYLNSVYFTGTITQVKPDGTPVHTANDRGEWTAGKYDFYDRVSHDGRIWLCVNERGTTSEPALNDPSWLLQVDKGDKGDQGEQGEGYTQLGRWYTGLLVPKMGVVSMRGSTYAAKIATRNPPLWCYTDKDGNRLTYKDGGYVLTGEVNTAEYDLWAGKGQDGKDGAQGLQGLQGKTGDQGISGQSGVDGKTTYFHIKYSASADGANMSETPDTYIGTYTDFTPQDSTNPFDYAWARFQGLQGTKGEQGIPGYNGMDGKTYYLHIKYSNDGGKTFTGNNGEESGMYIGVKTDLNPNDSNTPSDYRWSEIKGDKGDKGDGFTQLGRWYTGLLVPKMGVVSMGGGSYAAKVATRNPPLWCFTDNSGNRLTYKDGGYVLTGEINTTEYDVLSEKGEPGNDGKPGTDGKPGADGKPGTTGKQGIDGCIVRDSEWAVGVEYRNDSAITDGSLTVRYIDVALVRNNATETGWDAYRCLKTHVSSGSITYANTSYWQRFGANVSAIFTSLIVSKNAKINFLQGNQLLIQKADGTVTAGLSGSDAGKKVRFWAGAATPDEAPFRVSESGELVATRVNITGNVNAISGTFENVVVKNITSPNGKFSINAAGDVSIVGAFSTGSSGKRIIIDPSDQSMVFYVRDNAPVCSISFTYDESYDTASICTYARSSGSVVGQSILSPRYLDIADLRANKDITIAPGFIRMSEGGVYYTGLSKKIYYLRDSNNKYMMEFKNGILVTDIYAGPA